MRVETADWKGPFEYIMREFIAMCVPVTRLSLPYVRCTSIPLPKTGGNAERHADGR